MANFTLRKATRQKTPIKVALQGSAGSGKTMSALKLAKGLVDDWSKIVVIDTENGSADLYSHLGEYNVIQLAEFSPESYVDAIDFCEKQGMECIIIDSATPEWEYIIDAQSKVTGNSYTNWSKFTPRHNKFIKKILGSPCHIIATMRTKQDYVLVEKNGKQVPEKVGLKSVQRDGVDYEFTIVFDIDIKHNAHASKDRTAMFDVNVDFLISEDTGRKIKEWCENGLDIKGECLKAIEECKTTDDVNALAEKYKSLKVVDATSGKEVFPEDIRKAMRAKFDELSK